MTNSKPVGVSYEDPYLNGAEIHNSTFVDSDGSFTTIEAGSVLLTDPIISADQAVTKSYADMIAAGLTPHEPVQFSMAGNFASAYDNGTLGVGATLSANVKGALSVDGGSPVVTNRIGVVNQTNPAENGIYVVTDAGSEGSKAVLTRATDFNTAAEMTKYSSFYTEGGDTLKRAVYYQSSDDVAVVGTDSISFTEQLPRLGALALLDKVGTSNIDDSAVTYAKIQYVSATDRVLGRYTAEAGIVEEITCTSAGRALLDDADNSEQRTTLGLGSLAVLNSVTLIQSLVCARIPDVPVAGTKYVIVAKAPAIFDILSAVQGSTSLGTAGTYQISINSTPVGGLDGVTNYTTTTETPATSANSVGIGDEVSVIFSGIVTPVGLFMDLKTSQSVS